jgi:hypothetical protein
LGGQNRSADQQDQPASPILPAAPKEPDYYPAGYSEMKAAAAIFAKENFGMPGEGVHAIEDCQEPFENEEIDPAGDRKTLELEALARRVAKQEHFLSQLYPSEVYEQPLSDYERAALELALEMPPPPDYSDPNRAENPAYDEWESKGWKLKERLANAIEERRRRLAPKARATIVGGECGAGEQPFIVKTNPADGRVWLTTKFSFDLCRARKLDPWNVEACRWTELSPEKESYLSGRYVYLAQWPGGGQRRGVRAFDGAMGEDKAVEVVIARP